MAKNLLIEIGTEELPSSYIEPAIKQLSALFEETMKHKGFAFIEVIQPCLIFHQDTGFKERIYSLQEAKKSWYRDISRNQRFKSH